MPLTEDEARAIGKVVAHEVVTALREADYDSLMLHSIPYMHGSPGIVVHEDVAKVSPCRCIEYQPGKKLCFKSGIIGALSDAQEATYCPTWEKMESPGLERRLAGWMEAKDICKAEIAPIPKGEKLAPWLTCMSRELSARGIRAGAREGVAR